MDLFRGTYFLFSYFEIKKNPIGTDLGRWGTLNKWSANGFNFVRIMFPKHLIDYVESCKVDIL